MRTLLVPTDFSTTAQNAAIYAIALGKQVHANRLLFLHTYELAVMADPMMPITAVQDIETVKEAAEKHVENCINEFRLSHAKDGIIINGIAEYGSLSSVISNIIHQQEVDLVVMGITGGGAMVEKLIGSNTINVASNVKIPVLIIPPHTLFTPIEKMVLACDFESLEKSLPLHWMSTIIQETHAELLVLNVEKTHSEMDLQFPSRIFGESSEVHRLLDKFNPSYHFVEGNDSFTHAVNDFLEEKGAQIVISVAQHKNFFQKLFMGSHTRNLAFHTKIPLLVMHQ